MHDLTREAPPEGFGPMAITLTSAQAPAVRRALLSYEYATAVEELARVVTGTSIDQGDLGPVMEARQRVRRVDRLLDQVGWEDYPTQQIRLEGEDEELRGAVRLAIGLLNRDVKEILTDDLDDVDLIQIQNDHKRAEVVMGQLRDLMPLLREVDGQEQVA